MSQIALRGAAFVPTGNPTTSWTATIPSQVLADDLLYLLVASRDSVGAGTLTVTDNDTGGNAWSKIGNSTDHKLSLWFKRATSATASKTVTVSNAVGSSAGVGKAFSSGSRGTTPHVNIVIESNAAANETHAGFTPDVPNAMVCAGVVNYANDNAVTSLSFATLGATTTTEKLSTGGSDCGAIFGHVRQANGPSATGNLTWAQTDGTTYSITWAIVPDIEATADIALGAATVAAEGSVESGPITGTLDVTLGAATTSAAGTVAVNGSTSATLGAATTTAQATVDVAASAALNLGAATPTAAGAVEVAGTASVTLGAATVAAEGTVEGSGISGTLDVTLGAATVAASAAVAINASSAASLDAATASGAGAVDIAGQAAATLGAATTTAAAAVEITGTASVTLGAATTTASGTVALSGALTATLGEATIVGAARVDVLAAASLTCGPATVSAEGVVGDPPIVGTLDVELGAATVSGVGAVDVAAALSALLGGAVVAGAGSMSITGSLAQSLGAATVTASGLSGSGPPPAPPATAYAIDVRSASLSGCYIRTPSMGHVTVTEG